MTVLRVACATWVAVLAYAAPLYGQVVWRDLVISLTGSVEDYNGNLSAVSNFVADSVENAAAAAGEVAIRGALDLFTNDRRGIELTFDGGLRQAAATGFKVRDYAPREWAGSASLTYRERMGSWARLVGRAGYRGRSVQDRPPPPFYLQSAYSIGSGSLGLVTRAFDGVSFDFTVDGEAADYRSTVLGSQALDLLDRRAAGVNAGARWGGSSIMRVFGGVRWTEYPNQASFVDDDPFRRDRRVNAGLEWTHVGTVFAQLGFEGMINRSNSNRPEYDAISVHGLFNVPLPGRLLLNVRAVVTGKSYVEGTKFARLVPGEEADNASIAYLQITRPLARNLDGAVRFGWTRAETDIGREYYRRFGGSIQFNFRPVGF